MSLSKLRFAAPLAMAFVAMAVTPACSAAKEAEAQGDCSATLEGAAFVQADVDLEAAADSMKLSVATACRNIAISDGSTTTMWSGSSPPTNDEVSDACTAAATVIGNLQAAAMGSFSLAIDGTASCTVDASVQGECDAKCSGDASCMGGDVTLECDPGKLSGQCSGTCNVGATCDGNPNVQVDCQGTCQGSCNGTITGGCDGTCMGKCDGTCKAGTDSNGNCMGGCMGTCTGTCSAPSASASCSGKCGGSCKVTQPNFMCSGGASCTGGCSVKVTAPSCKGSVTPPSCKASASCQGNCQTSAQARAVCTGPTVKIVTSGSAMVNGAVVAAIEKELPNLLVVFQAQGAALLKVIGTVGDSFKGAVSGSAACLAKIEGFVSASVSVNVSVMASANVSGKASGGTLGSLDPAADQRPGPPRDPAFFMPARRAPDRLRCA